VQILSDTDTDTLADTDTAFMRLALAQANCASDLGEVPVGAVLVQAGSVLATGCNRVIIDHDPSSHAEIVAMRAAGIANRNYRLPDTTLYVTLEPCAMCLAAMFHARIARVVYGASDAKTGACGGNIDLRHLSINHHTTVEGGVLQAECSATLQAFFKARRTAAKQLKIVVKNSS
jgi:tRNA(adenine34) deaminase